MRSNRTKTALLALMMSLGSLAVASAGEPGVTATEIKIGTILPFSGPASSYSTSGKAALAYFDKINAEGGINGRKIKIISYDDGYSPPKTFEMARKLIEGDEVSFLFAPFGTPGNIAIMKYMNSKKVPQLFVGSGGATFGDAKANPWTMGLRPDYHSEGIVYARYIMEKFPDAKIGVIYQNDDFGRDHLRGLKAGLGAKEAMIVAMQPYEVTSPSVDSQVVSLRAAGVDVLMNFSSNKFAAQTIRKVGELDWKPVQFLASASASVSSVLTPAGLQHANGILSAAYLKDPNDPKVNDDAGVIAWRAFMAQYYPTGDVHDLNIVTGYNAAQVLEQVLRQAGGDLSRANIMKQAENLKNVVPGMVLPGITVDTSPSDHRPMENMQMIQYEASGWASVGGVISGRSN
jgi:branched-chain amino acid transport system substrate-binding protein